MIEIGYRILINGFPKAGTHLVEQMVKIIAPPMVHDRPWAGSFRGNSWSDEWVEDYQLFRLIGQLADINYATAKGNTRSYAKGHMGYRRDIELFLWGIGAVVIFVYRDPRDIAVSQVHHILNDGTHPEKEPYREAFERDGFSGPLRMVIEGYQGETFNFPGVMERWEYYAPWLGAEWVLSLRYEDLISRRAEMAEGIIKTCVGRASMQYGRLAKINKRDLKRSVRQMVAASKNTAASPTFRKGRVGGWRKHFNGEMRDLWIKHDPEGWTERLGY